MKTPKNWKELERHPLSAAYADIEGAAWEHFVRNLISRGIVGHRKVVLHHGKVIDGWQLQRACVEAAKGGFGIKPLYQELKLPRGMTIEQYVETVNDHRRHETQEQAVKRIEKRRERVAQARAEGKSIRTIAQDEGVDPKTVREDLKASGGDQSPPETVKGQDGKTYPARQARSDGDGQERPGDDAGHGEAPGGPVKLFDPARDEGGGPPTPEEEMKEVNGKIESFCRGLMKYVEENLPDDFRLRFGNAREGARRKVKDACEMLRSAKCAGLCPACKGGKDEGGKECPHCHGTRRLPKIKLECVQ
jgi:hypothetical protein